MAAAAAALAYCASDAQRAKCPELANHSIVFIIERSTNDNIVVYEAIRTGQGAAADLDPRQPIAVYWQDIDDAYMQKLLAKGQTSFRSALNLVESKMAYGISAEMIEKNRFKLTLVALPSKQVELVLVQGPDGQQYARARATIAGHPAYLRKIFVEAKSGLLGPKVVEIRVYGVRVDNGSEVTEIIKP